MVSRKTCNRQNNGKMSRQPPQNNPKTIQTTLRTIQKTSNTPPTIGQNLGRPKKTNTPTNNRKHKTNIPKIPTKRSIPQKNHIRTTKNNNLTRNNTQGLTKLEIRTPPTK